MTVDIAAPVQRVFNEVSDLTRHPTWSADPLEIRAEDEAPIGVGKRYRSTATSKGKMIRGEIEITDHQPPSRFAFSVHDLTGDYSHAFHVTSHEGMTRVERDITATLGVSQRVLFALVYRAVKLPNAKRAMASLRVRCEEQATG